MHAEISGIVKQRKILADGTVRVYAYVGRGGDQLCYADGETATIAEARLSALLGKPETLAKLAEIALASSIPQYASDKLISGLVQRYLASPAFKNKAESTKRSYRRYLEMFDDEFGDWKVRFFERHDAGRDIVEWRNDVAGNKARTADYIIQSVSRLFSWARSEYLTSARPVDDVERLHQCDRSDIVWTDDEVSAVVNAASTSELKWAIQLAAISGLRQGDLLRLPWSAIQGAALVRKTSKRGRTVVLPVEPLRELLDSIAKRSPVILTSSLRRPWAPDGDGLRSSFDAAKKKAGVEGKRWHDLRGTAATRLVKAGLPASQVALWMGWSPQRVEHMKAIYVSHEAVALDMLSRMNEER